MYPTWCRPLNTAALNSHHLTKGASPAYHVLLVATGGLGTRQEVANAAILGFIKDCATPCPGKAVVTVCTGAGLAAKAGILKGKQATTNKAAWAWATAQGEPGSIAWQKRARWVQDGNVWTSAGVTAGELLVIKCNKYSQPQCKGGGEWTLHLCRD